jgi:hypothetical protein
MDNNSAKHAITDASGNPEKCHVQLHGHALFMGACRRAYSMSNDERLSISKGDAAIERINP